MLKYIRRQPPDYKEDDMGFFRKRNAKMAEIQADEQKRKRSGHFAVFSFVLDIIAAACAVGGIFLFSYGASSDAWTSLTILAILPLGLGVGLLIGTLVMLIWSLVMMITQFAINRSAWSWVALALFIATVAAIIIVGGYLLNQISI